MSPKHSNRGINTALSVQAEMQWSGPLPHPEALDRYNLILPGAAERIIAMAETQHEHRLRIENKVIDSNVSAQRLGTILGFVIVMTAILGGIFLIYVGKDASGLTAIISALAGLAGVFVYGKRAQKRELGEKANTLTTSR